MTESPTARRRGVGGAGESPVSERGEILALREKRACRSSAILCAPGIRPRASSGRQRDPRDTGRLPHAT